MDPRQDLDSLRTELRRLGRDARLQRAFAIGAGRDCEILERQVSLYREALFDVLDAPTSETAQAIAGVALGLYNPSVASIRGRLHNSPRPDEMVPSPLAKNVG